MQRKLYFIAALFLLNPTSWGWSSYKAKIGGQVAFPYQSSNPTVELKTTRNINQQLSEECYLFAFAGALEVANKNAWNRPQGPEVSAEYLFVRKLLVWSKDVLVNHEATINESFYFLEGGDVHHAMKLSLEEGLLPQEMFKPKIPFAKWDFAKLYSDLKTIVVDGRRVIGSSRNEATKAQLIDLFLSKIQKRIEAEAGFQSQVFNWSGRNWTTQQFENSFGIKRNSHVFMLYARGQWDMGDPWDLRRALKDMIHLFQGAFNFRQSSWTQVWQYLISSIDNGLPAMLSMKWAGSYHVLNVVGYEYNNRNEIVSFKLKNSWGEDYGDKGHAFFGLQDIQNQTTTIWGFRAP